MATSFEEEFNEVMARVFEGRLKPSDPAWKHIHNAYYYGALVLLTNPHYRIDVIMGAEQMARNQDPGQPPTEE